MRVWLGMLILFSKWRVYKMFGKVKLDFVFGVVYFVYFFYLRVIDLLLFSFF